MITAKLMVVVVLSAIVLVQITPSAVSSCLKMETENKQTNKKKRYREKEVGWRMRKAEENKRKHKLEMPKYYKYEPVQ